MKRYEYCFIEDVRKNENPSLSIIFSNGQVIKKKSEKLANVLRDLGQDKWEMVGCGQHDDYNHNIYFKREI